MLFSTWRADTRSRPAQLATTDMNQLLSQAFVTVYNIPSTVPIAILKLCGFAFLRWCLTPILLARDRVSSLVGSRPSDAGDDPDPFSVVLGLFLPSGEDTVQTGRLDRGRWRAEIPSQWSCGRSTTSSSTCSSSSPRLVATTVLVVYFKFHGKHCRCLLLLPRKPSRSTVVVVVDGVMKISLRKQTTNQLVRRRMVASLHSAQFAITWYD